MRPEDAGEGGMVPSQTGDDALSTVPVDEYETVFSSRERCAVNVHSTQEQVECDVRLYREEHEWDTLSR